MKKGSNAGETAPEAPRKKVLQRNHVVTITLNDPEFKTLEKYCAQYNITNRTRFIRESLMKAMLQRLGEDYPTLFQEREMR